MHRNAGIREAAKLFHHLQAAFALLRGDEVFRLGLALQFIEHEARHHDGAAEETGAEQAQHAAVTGHAEIEHHRLAFGAFTAKAHKRDQEGKMIAITAQGEADAEEGQRAVDAHFDDGAQHLGIGLVLKVGELEHADARDEPGAEQADGKAHRGMRKVTQRETGKDDIERQQHRHVTEPEQGPDPRGLLHAEGDGDAHENGQRKKHRPHEADGPGRLHKAPGLTGNASGRKAKMPGGRLGLRAKMLENRSFRRRILPTKTASRPAKRHLQNLIACFQGS